MLRARAPERSREAAELATLPSPPWFDSWLSHIRNSALPNSEGRCTAIVLAAPIIPMLPRRSIARLRKV